MSVCTPCVSGASPELGELTTLPFAGHFSRSSALCDCDAGADRTSKQRTPWHSFPASSPRTNSRRSNDFTATSLVFSRLNSKITHPSSSHAQRSTKQTSSSTTLSRASPKRRARRGTPDRTKRFCIEGVGRRFSESLNLNLCQLLQGRRHRLRRPTGQDAGGSGETTPQRARCDHHSRGQRPVCKAHQSRIAEEEDQRLNQRNKAIPVLKP